MLLTDIDREKFIQWLIDNINDSKIIQAQFGKLDLPIAMINQLNTREETVRTAYQVVLEVLQSIEEL